MSTTLGTTLGTTRNTITPRPFAWPLAPTKHPHAHLTWAEWTAQQAATIASERRVVHMAPVRALSAQRSPVTAFERGSTPLPVWPLPATQLPNAHLTWAVWLDVQATGAIVEPLAQRTSELAA
jgi:hypothetical protein